MEVWVFSLQAVRPPSFAHHYIIYSHEPRYHLDPNSSTTELRFCTELCSVSLHGFCETRSATSGTPVQTRLRRWELVLGLLRTLPPQVEAVTLAIVATEVESAAEDVAAYDWPALERALEDCRALKTVTVSAIAVSVDGPELPLGEDLRKRIVPTVSREFGAKIVYV